MSKTGGGVSTDLMQPVAQSHANVLTRHIGYNLLGPVVHRWLLGLHQYISYFDDGHTSFLYCARAGVRIRELYRLFLAGLDREADKNHKVFWVSRFSVAKGTFVRNRAGSTGLISREYLHWPMHTLVKGIFRHHSGRLDGLDLGRREHEAHGHVFDGWLEGETPEALATKRYLQECSAAFEEYVAELLTGAKRAVLIDSGWQGTTQGLLAKAFGEIEWWGLYFGRILSSDQDPAVTDRVIGTVFEVNAYDPAIPESAFILHRHLIETLLEPNAPSIEEIPAGPFRTIAKSLIAANLNERIDGKFDAFYLYCQEYLRANAGLAVAEVMSRYQRAMPSLARILVMPTREEALAMVCKDRSADFGKPISVPILVPPDHPEHKDSEQRVARSLWPQGQIALEQHGYSAHDMQLQLTGTVTAAAYFDPAVASSAAVHPTNPVPTDEAPPEKPIVAVITRTKNRPMLLARAARSVAMQTYDNYIWVIVNDGGDAAEVRKVINASAVDRRKVLLLNNSRSVGMEAASNKGIRACASDYILIHDDDDSLAPRFLEETIGFLEKAGGARYGGVITHSTYVSEEIRGNSVIEHSRTPYMNWVKNVHIAEMASDNFFPPIAFLYRRTVWDAVGGYNEHLPVLGDWAFNLEFLLEADIGLIPKPLAFYHHRDRANANASAYANSVVGGVAKHEEFTSIFRNEFFRRNSKNSAALTILGYINKELRHQTARVGTIVTERSASSASQDLNVLMATSDRYWAISNVNKAAIDKNTKLSRGTVLKPLEPDARWSEVWAAMAVLRAVKIHVPIPADFDEAGYMEANPDVVNGVNAGQFSSGYEHYLLFGRREKRSRPSIFVQ